MRLTIVHPAIGHRQGESYIRTWQMEPLPVARIAGLTPSDIEPRFYDDRMEEIPWDEPTDLVAISIETYTARRAYEIASEYRQRGVPVVMGGFHATLCPEEVSRYAEAIVTGEADSAWPQLIDDFRHGRLQSRYRGETVSGLQGVHYNRNIFRDKRYLRIGLIETGRGCPYRCEFCAIQSFFQNTHRRRPDDETLAEIESLRHERDLFFFVDDNFAGHRKQTKDFLRELAKLNVRWVTQMSVDGAHDEEFVSLAARAGCQGVLIGFESLDETALRAMDKTFAVKRGGYGPALQNLRKHGVRVYGTFIFGNDHDTPASFDEAVSFARDHEFYIAAFNHLTPFPGTPLYDRLLESGRLNMPAWWIDPRYRYNTLPFEPRLMSAEDVRENCIRARRQFYSWPSMLKRGFSGPNRRGYMFRHFFPINLMHRFDIGTRDGYPLGDDSWSGRLLEV